MKKIDIIKLFEKEVGLFFEQYDENDLGEEYLSSIELKEAEQVITELRKKIEEHNEAIKELKEVINSYSELDSKKTVVVYKSANELIKNIEIHINDKIFFIDCSQLVFTGNIFKTLGIVIDSAREELKS